MSGRPGAGERAEKAWGLLKELVRIDTTNPPGNEAPAAEVLRRFLEAGGSSCSSVAKEPARPNLIARAGEGEPAILLAAHLDVVPADASRWSVPPFEAREVDGYLYGRGAIDMKHMAAMSAVLFVEASRRKPTKSLILAALADEEAGCRLGSKFLVEEHPELVRAPYMLGEGGGFTQYAAGVRFYPIGRAEKGHLTLRLFFSGSAGHGSMPHPDNAAFIAAKGVLRLKPGSLPLHVTSPARDFFRALGKAGGLKGAGLRALTVPALGKGALALLPPKLASSLRALLSHTVSPTRFKGSTAINVIPDVVTVDLDVRTLPGFELQEVLAELWKALGCEIRHEVLEFTPGVVSPIDTPLFAALAKTVRAHDPGAAAVPFLIPGFTDASYFRRLGIACYGFAPLVLTPRDAAEFRFRVHGNDERLARDAFFRGYAMLEDAVFGFLGV